MTHTFWKCCKCDMYNYDITIQCTGRGTFAGHSVIACGQRGGQCKLVKGLEKGPSKKSNRPPEEQMEKRCVVS